MMMDRLLNVALIRLHAGIHVKIDSEPILPTRPLYPKWVDTSVAGVGIPCGIGPRS